MVILFAILVGVGISYFFFFKEEKKEYEYISAFQVGVFTSYENAKDCAERNHGIVVNDNDMYRVYVSLVTDDDLKRKLSSYFNKKGIKYYIKKIQVDKKIKSHIQNEEKKYYSSNIETYVDMSYQVLLKYQNSL